MAYGAILHSFFCWFSSFLRSSVIFWPILTCNMTMESYRLAEYACFFSKSQKIKALGQKILIFLLFYVALQICPFWNIPTIPTRINVSHICLVVYPLSSPPVPPREHWRSCRGWSYPKMKIKIIIQIPTIENPRIHVSHVFWLYNPSSPPAPP